MCISKGTPNLTAAARWMNYVYDPENAAKITAWVQYISPVKGVKEALIAQGDDGKALAESPLLFPDAETLSNTHVFGELDQQDDIDVQTRFNEITG
jgi:spermidine/putrescine transport system substrate-binding protein